MRLQKSRISDSLVVQSLTCAIQIIIKALDRFTRTRVVRLLLFNWELKVIAKELYCYYITVYRIQANLWLYNILSTPLTRPKRGPRKLYKIAEKNLI